MPNVNERRFAKVEIEYFVQNLKHKLGFGINPLVDGNTPIGTVAVAKDNSHIPVGTLVTRCALYFANLLSQSDAVFGNYTVYGRADVNLPFQFVTLGSVLGVPSNAFQNAPTKVATQLSLEGRTNAGGRFRMQLMEQAIWSIPRRSASWPIPPAPSEQAFLADLVGDTACIVGADNAYVAVLGGNTVTYNRRLRKLRGLA